MLMEPGGDASVAAVAGMTFLAAGNQSVDSPARSTSFPVAAGRENVAAAIALLSISGQITMPLSLPVAGILNQVLAPGAVHASTLLAWLLILPLIAMLTLEGKPAPVASRGMLSSIATGLNYTRSHRPILGTISIVLIVQLIGMPVATPLGPMCEIEVLGFTPAQVGLMGATWGLGSLPASLMLARAGGLARRGATWPLFQRCSGSRPWDSVTRASSRSLPFRTTAWVSRSLARALSLRRWSSISWRTKCAEGSAASFRFRVASPRRQPHLPGLPAVSWVLPCCCRCWGG